eukprot:g39613.t1
MLDSINKDEIAKYLEMHVKPRKASGPDGVPRHALRSCVDQLTGIFADIFNLSLLQSEVPTCFKKTTFIPVPKKTHATCLNDCYLVALTSIIMECFESKTKELIISFRKQGGGDTPIYIIGAEVEIPESVKFLG